VRWGGVQTKHGGRGIKLMMLDKRTYYLLATSPEDAQVQAFPCVRGPS
jgi:hypothetical protein